MGQVPFYPPNVSGWKQGPAFLNTNTAHAYWQTTGYLLDQTISDPGSQTPTAAVTAGHLGALAPVGLERHPRRSSRPTPPTSTPRAPGPTLGLARPRRAPDGDAGDADGRSRRPPPLTMIEEPRPDDHCGCNDWQSTHRRSMLRRQGQVVPIPRAVLEGESAGMCGRDFLRNGAVAFLTVYGASMLDWGQHLGGGIGAGRDARHRSDHRLGLPGRRQRRPEHADPDHRVRLRRLRVEAPAHRARHRPTACRWAERPPTPTGPGTRPRPASSSCTTPARSPSSRRSTTCRPTSRTSTRAPSGRPASSTPTPPPAGWAAGSTRTAPLTTRCRRCRSAGRWTGR